MRTPYWFLLAVASAGGLLLLAGCRPDVSPVGPGIPGNPVILDEADCTGVSLNPDSCDVPTGAAATFPTLPCPTATEAAEIQRDFSITVNRDASAGTLSCRARDGSVDLSPVLENIYQALLFLRRVQFDRPLPWTNLSAYDWARRVTANGIYIESTGNSHAGLNSRAIHVVFSSYTPYRPVPSSIDSVAYGIIFHEGRHAEGWPHTCARTAEYGNIHDKSVAEMGAFGVQYLMDYWVGHYSGESADFRQFALRRAAQLLHVFCCECGGGGPTKSTTGAFSRNCQVFGPSLAGRP